jgi:hypothetical protein
VKSSAIYTPRVVTIGALAAILKMADILKIWKMQNCSSNGDLSLGQILCLYHYTFRELSTLMYEISTFP